MGFPCVSTGEESGCNAGGLGSIPGLGRSPGEGKGYPLQYSGLENSMDCIVHGIAKSQTQLSDFHFTLKCSTFSSVTPVGVRLFATPWTAHQASLSITNSQSLLKLISIESVMPSKHLILCSPLILPLSVFPSSRVFSNESVLSLPQVAKVSEFQLQHQSFQWIFRADFL